MKKGLRLAINSIEFAGRKTCAASSALLDASTTGINIALYKLTESYQELEQRTAACPFAVSS